MSLMSIGQHGCGSKLKREPQAGLGSIYKVQRQQGLKCARAENPDEVPTGRLPW